MELIAVLRRIRACEGEAAAQLVLEYAIKEAVDAGRMECANEIERISGETYAVVLCEHKEAANWLRSNAI